MVVDGYSRMTLGDIASDAVDLVECALDDLRNRGEVREDIDSHTLATICFGSYSAAFLRGYSDREDLAEKVAATLWPGSAVVHT